MIAAPHHYDVKRADALSDDERAAWRAYAHAEPALWSPYLQLEFVEHMQALSNRVGVVIVRAAGAPIGFLPFMRVVAGFAQPPAGPVCDTHGLVGDLGAPFDLDGMLAAAGLSFYSFHGVPAEQAALAAHARTRYDGMAVDLREGYEAWLNRITDGGTRQSFKEMNRKQRKLEREYGAIRFVLDDRAETAFAALLRWKSEQYRRSRYYDTFSARWVVALLRRLWAVREGPLQGRLSSLYAGDRLLAVHFGMKGAYAGNYWFPAYDREAHNVSPGLILLHQVFRAWAEEGVKRVDCGGGETQLKLQFADQRTPLMAGLVRRPSLAGRAYRGFGAVSDVIAKAPNAFVAKLPHRIGARVRNRLCYGLV